jgi:hypothetical protein
VGAHSRRGGQPAVRRAVGVDRHAVVAHGHEAHDLELRQPADELRAAGIDVLRWPVPLSRREILGLEGPEDVCGITVPTLAVAERGTLVLEASQGHGRGLDVTNRHHVSLLPADRIVETLGQALAQTYAPDRPIPSAVSLVSGPSRSSDIEKISTLGAHGALTEHVVIISG